MSFAVKNHILRSLLLGATSMLASAQASLARARRWVARAHDPRLIGTLCGWIR
jgi:hypothetical protein